MACGFDRDGTYLFVVALLSIGIVHLVHVDNKAVGDGMIFNLFPHKRLGTLHFRFEIFWKLLAHACAGSHCQRFATHNPGAPRQPANKTNTAHFFGQRLRFQPQMQC